MIYLGGINVNHIQYMYYPATLKDCPEKFKEKTAIRLVDMSVCDNLVGGFGGTQNFKGCTNLHTVRLPIGPNYTFEGKNNWKFRGTAIYSIVIPEAVTSIGTDNFYDCKNLESIYILGNQTSLGQRNFEKCTNLTNIYILGDNPTIDLTSFTENFVECEGKDFRSTGKYFFFVTTNMEYLNGVKDAIGAIDIVSYDEYIGNEESYTDGRYIISGTNICDVYYGNHNIDESSANECAGICVQCGIAVVNHSEKAEVNTSILYESYVEKGTKTTKCTNDGCTYCVSEETPALFTCTGYSVAEYGANGIAVGFTANNKAIDEYENVTGKDVSYGVFAVLQSKLGDGEIFDKDGNKGTGVVNADLTSHRFDIFEFKIVGFTDAQKDTKLALGAYVSVTDENGTEYSYLQVGTKAENEKYVFVTYNEVVK